MDTYHSNLSRSNSPSSTARPLSARLRRSVGIGGSGERTRRAAREDIDALRAEQHSNPISSPTFLHALDGLENPVPQSILHIADTLTTSPEDDVADENLRFLRTPADPQEEWRAENAREENARDRQRTALEHRAEERQRRERMLQVMNRLARLRGREHQSPTSSSGSGWRSEMERLARNEPLSNSAGTSGARSYGERLPESNNLYDWAPSSNEPNEENELEQLMRELRQQQPNVNPEILRVIGQSQLESERQSQDRAYTSRFLSSTQPSHSSESSLRATAIVQSVRRHPRFSERSRHYMQRYNTDRDNAHGPSLADPVDRLFSPRISAVTVREPSRYEQNRRAWLQEHDLPTNSSGTERARGPNRDLRARIDSFRRNYLSNPSERPSSSKAAPKIEEGEAMRRAFDYLAKLRNSSSPEESRLLASECGIDKDRPNLLLDLNCIPPPEETSWLQPGAVLSGSQHATSNLVSNTNTMNSQTRSTSIYPEHLTPSFPPATDNRSSTHQTQPFVDLISHDTSPHDRWPVKVSIHSIDTDTKTLSATMEAFNVPSQPPSRLPLNNSRPDAINGSSSSRASLFSSQPNHYSPSSITTYLEGEILDFRNITFLTESFPADIDKDVSHWGLLGPFRDLRLDELADHLLDQNWLAEISKKYIFMRWKERCFVKPGPKREAPSAIRPSSPPRAEDYPAAWQDQQDGLRHVASASTATSSWGWTGAGSAGLNGSAMTGTLMNGTATNGISANGISSSTNNPSTNHRLDRQTQPSYTSSSLLESGPHLAYDPTDNFGLTISGFYYVCLRREDGNAEGLYCDKDSQPYQHLRLASVKRGVRPGYGFR